VWLQLQHGYNKEGRNGGGQPRDHIQPFVSLPVTTRIVVVLGERAREEGERQKYKEERERQRESLTA
jgi:hypothetical protein